MTLLQQLAQNHSLSHADFLTLLTQREQLAEEAATRARAVCEAEYGNRIYIRGLIEVSNICRNDCYYCGIRKSNAHVTRYRLTAEEILSCCEEGYALGFRTFVMQGGEDAALADAFLVPLLQEIKRRWPDCAVTLSLGERSRESYAALYAAGANRYLLRHEAANPALYAKLHPAALSHQNRLCCLRELLEIGYQTGMGFMVGAPFQTLEDLAAELCLLGEYRPQMVGIGPFLPHHETPFATYPAGTADLTVYLLSLIRLLLPHALIPATTALNSVSEDGRIRGILAGANVIMPNLSPMQNRAQYTLYDNKRATGLESAQALEELRTLMATAGRQIVTDRGDYRAAH